MPDVEFVERHQHAAATRATTKPRLRNFAVREYVSSEAGPGGGIGGIDVECTVTAEQYRRLTSGELDHG